MKRLMQSSTYTMEPFEKAHTSKRKKLHKESKSHKKIKKALSQMLEGYKKNDYTLIKDSVKFTDEINYSSSVSGYSDLTLTSNGCDSFENLQELTASSYEKCIPDLLVDNCDSKFVNNSLSEDTLSDSLEVHLSDSSDGETQHESKASDSESCGLDGTFFSNIKSNSCKSQKKSVVNEKESSDSFVTNKVEDKKVLNNQSLNKSKSVSFVCDSRMTCKTLNEVLGVYKNLTYKNIHPYEPNEFTVKFNTEENDNITDDSVTNINETLDVNVNNGKSRSNVRVGDRSFSSLKFSENEVQLNDVLEDTSESFQYSENELSLNETDDLQFNSDKMDFNENIGSSNLQSSKNEQLLNETAEEPKIDKDPNIIEVLNKKNTWILTMSNTSDLYFHGKLKVQVLTGSIKIFGYTLQNEMVKVYAPYYSYVQCLKSVNGPSTNTELLNKLTSSDLSISNINTKKLMAAMKENNTTICLQVEDDPKWDFVEYGFNVTNIFNKTKAKKHNDSLAEISEKLACTFYRTHSKCFVENEDWHKAISLGSKPGSRGIVCGGKDTGKSTFLRYYVNHLLSKGPVLVIDLDPGQCEFTVAGNVSATVVDHPLLGPNFTHLQTPQIMYNTGMIDTMEDPERYIEAVQQVIKHCMNDEQLCGLPWIVNTMGMCNTMGLKFMCIILYLMNPTFLVQLDSDNSKKRFELELNSNSVNNLYYEQYYEDPLFSGIISAELNYELIFTSSLKTTNKKTPLAPRDERYLNFSTYFGELLNIYKTDNILAVTPYEVCLSDMCVAMTVEVKHELVKLVLNAKIVALCSGPQDKYKKGAVLLLDEPLVCHGQGLIRAIDNEKNAVYIITPVPLSKLVSVNVLVYSKWVPELRGTERTLPEGTEVPYLYTVREDQQKLTSTPKRKFNPRHLLKMMRNTGRQKNANNL